MRGGSTSSGAQRAFRTRVRCGANGRVSTGKPARDRAALEVLHQACQLRRSGRRRHPGDLVVLPAVDRADVQGERLERDGRGELRKRTQPLDRRVAEKQQRHVHRVFARVSLPSTWR